MSKLEPTLTYSNLTATARLRAMLDERGVQWGASDTWRLLVTSWKDASGHSWAFVEHRDGSFIKLTAYNLTPEQAIDATLGAGTCEADETDTIKCWVKCKDEPSTEHMELIHVMECSECGHTYEHVNGDYEFCPRCGRRIEVDDG